MCTSTCDTFANHVKDMPVKNVHIKSNFYVNDNRKWRKKITRITHNDSSFYLYVKNGKFPGQKKNDYINANVTKINRFYQVDGYKRQSKREIITHKNIVTNIFTIM